MGVYRVNAYGEEWELRSPRDLAPDEILSGFQGLIRRKYPSATDSDITTAVETSLFDTSPVIPAGAERFLRAHPGIAQGAALATRIAGPVLTGAAGTLAAGPFGTVAGAMTGGLWSGLAAQEIEKAAGLREAEGYGTLTADVLLSGVPGARAAREIGAAGKIGKAALRGAGYGLAQKTLETGIEEQRLPRLGEAGMAAGVGGAMGGGLQAAGTAGGAVYRAARGLRRTPAVAAEVPTAVEKPPVAEALPEQPTIPLEVEPEAVGEVPPIAPVERRTPAGFLYPEGVEPVQHQPMPADRIPKFARSIAESPEEEAEIAAQLERMRPQLEAQGMGRIPDSEIERARQTLQIPAAGEVPVREHGEYRPRQAFNTEELATLHGWAKAAKDRLNDIRTAANAAPEDMGLRARKAEAEQDWLRLVRIYGGARSEPGRTLRYIQVLGQTETGKPLARGGKLVRAIQAAGKKGLLRTGTDVRELADLVVLSMDDPIAAARMLRDAMRIPNRERLRNWVYFSYLSRPATQVRNFLGNTEALTEAPAAAGLAALSGERGVRLSELGKPVVIGATTGGISGARKAFEILANGVTNEDIHGADFLLNFLQGKSPTELATLRGISLPGDPFAKRAARMVTRGVPRALQAMDVMFRTIAKEITAHQAAYRLANRQMGEIPRTASISKSAIKAHFGIPTKEALRLGIVRPVPDDPRYYEIAPKASAAKLFRDRRNELAAKILTDPNEANLVELMGKRAVYQETPGEIARKLTDWGDSGGAGLAVRLLLMPFARTPANIIRRAYQKVPVLGLKSVMNEWRRQLKAEGIDPNSAAAERFRAQLLGEHALGYAAVVPLVWLAEKGIITATAPDKPGAKARFYEKGNRPGTLRVKVGDQTRSISLSAFGHAGSFANSIGAAVDELKRTGDKEGFLDRVFTATGAAAMSFRDASFLAGLKDLFDTGTGDFDLKSLSRIAGRKAVGIAVPGIAQEVKRVVEPTVRKPTGEEGIGVAVKEFEARTPGLSQGVPPRIGTFGQQVRESTGETVGERIVSVLTGTTIVTTKPMREELDRLEKALGPEAEAVGPAPPKDEPRFNLGQGRKIDLGVTSQTALKQALGHARGLAIQKVMTSSLYNQQTDQQRATAIRRASRKAGAAVRSKARAAIQRRMRLMQAGQEVPSLTFNELLP